MVAVGNKPNQILKILASVIIAFDLPVDLFMCRTALRRKIEKIFSEKADDYLTEKTGLYTLGYDERTDQTLMPNGKTAKEPHITFTGDHGEYIDHDAFIGEKKDAKNTAKKIYDVLEKTKSVDTITILDSDGTNTNTGWKGTFIS